MDSEKNRLTALRGRPEGMSPSENQKEDGMRNKLTVLVFAFVLVFAGMSFAEEGAGPSVHVGGHIKLTLFDRPVSIIQANGAQTGIEKSYGIGFREFNFFVDGRINDWIGFQVDPRISASSGATPKFGVTQTATAGTTYSLSGFGHGKAVVILKLPYDIEMELGQVHPIFTVEYGRELFWEETANGGKFACNDNIGSLHDNGIELEKTFELGEFSIPAYLYLLNGGTENGAFDLNNQPGIMLHAEPAWGPIKLLGSAYLAKTDASETKLWQKYALGVMADWEGFSFRAEGVRGKKEKYTATHDLISEGYYFKLLYKVLPWLKLHIMHESVYDNLSSSNPVNSKAPYVDVGERFLGWTAGAVFYLSDETLLQFAVDVEDWRSNDGKFTTVYTRPFLGMRITY